VPGGFTLNATKTTILDPAGAPLEEGFEMGPNW
jgi:hypothetical protein